MIMNHIQTQGVRMTSRIMFLSLAVMVLAAACSQTEVPAEQHSIANFLLIEVAAELAVGERRGRADAQHETEPRAIRAAVGGIPSETLRRPFAGVRGQ